MRLALLGPSQGDLPALARGAASALQTLHADSVVYLSSDGALDAVVEGWTELLGATPPLAERVSAILDADAATIRAEIDRERAKRRLSLLRSLPFEDARSIEMLNDRLVLLVEDSAVLDEEDLLPASVIVFGLGPAMLRRVGSRVFLSPGLPCHRSEGLLLLEEGGPGAVGLNVLHCDVDGQVKSREFIEATRSARLRVQGAV
ncbi:MAG: hypothetical protein NVS3B20_02830 [Polyangiales bacterium]